MKSRAWWARRVAFEIALLAIGIWTLVWGAETEHSYAVVAGIAFIVGSTLVLGVFACLSAAMKRSSDEGR